MKIIKIFLFAVVIIIGGITIYLATLDGHYDTSRTRVMQASAETIFPFVTDFKEWPHWSPWSEQFGDDMKIEYSGAESGVGAKYNWTGEQSGAGFMETTAVDMYNRVDQTITFTEPFNSTSDIYWKFEKTAEGTKVTWGMKGEMSFFLRFMADGMDKQMEKDFLRGLEKLDSVSKFRMEEEIAIADMLQEDKDRENNTEN